MVKKGIKFNVPYIGKDEAEAASKAIHSMEIVGDGAIGKKAESMLEEMFGTKHVLLTTSCTHALELGLMSIDVRPGDEVIVPSFTFVSTANAIVRQKARPVFAEIDEADLNISVEDMKNRITPKTRAIIPVHYAGVACDMDGIEAAIGRREIAVIEDAAHGIGAKYKNKFLGTIGDMGCFSFHASKNITCGEGGALLTSNDRYCQRAEIAREKGTNRSAYLKGEIDKYSWISEGSSYVLSDILAAALIEQLKKMNEITEKRKNIFNHYMAGLKKLEKEGKIFLPRIGKNCDVNGHIFYIRLHTEKERDRCIAELKKKGVETTFHFVPLHTSPYGKKTLGYKTGDFPATERMSETLLRLPIYPGLSEEDLDFIIETITEILS